MEHILLPSSPYKTYSSSSSSHWLCELSRAPSTYSLRTTSQANVAASFKMSRVSMSLIPSSISSSESPRSKGLHLQQSASFVCGPSHGENGDSSKDGCKGRWRDIKSLSRLAKFASFSANRRCFLDAMCCSRSLIGRSICNRMGSTYDW